MAIPAVLGGLLKAGAGAARVGAKGMITSAVSNAGRKGAKNKIKAGSALVRRDGGGSGKGLQGRLTLPIHGRLSGSQVTVTNT